MKTTYVNSNDVRLYAKVNEPKDPKNTETIIFLHGYPDTHKTWSSQIEAFKENYRIIIYDLRGAGASTPPKDRTGYHIDFLMHDLDTVIKELANNTKVHLIGHDWGAVIGWCYISIPSYASKIKSFTAIGAPHPTLALKNLLDNLISLDPISIFQAVQQIFKAWHIAIFQMPRLAEFILYTSPELVWKALVSKIGLAENDEMKHKSREEILSSTIGPINLYREMVQGGVPPLPQDPIDIPVTVIIPQQDLALTNLVYENIDRLVKTVDIRKIQANHWVHREKPGEVNKLISIFLKRALVRNN